MPGESPSTPVIRSAMRLVLVCAVLALTACGGEEQRGGGDRGGPEPFVELEDRLGFSSAGIMEQQIRVEGLIQRCMRQHGFEYVPVDPFAQQTTVGKAARLSDEEFLRQFGYGISTFWGRDSRRQVMPNDRIRASLSPADRRAYDRALWGDYPETTFVDAVDNGDLTRVGGCTKEAAQAAFGDGRLIERMVARFDALDERINEDPRMVRADDRWRECMASAGYSFQSSDEIEEHFMKRMEAIVGPFPGPLATGPPAGQKPRPYDRAALVELQREEIRVARTEYDCERKHITPVEAVVRPEYEARFRERNQDLIRSVRAVWK